MTASAQSTARVDGAAWGASASGWVEYWAGFAAPARELKASRPSDPLPFGEPGVLEQLARQAGLIPERADEVEVPYELPTA